MHGTARVGTVVRVLACVVLAFSDLSVVTAPGAMPCAPPGARLPHARRTWRTAGGGFGRAGSGPRRDRRGAGQLEGRLAGLQPAAVCAGGPSAARWLLAALLQEGGGGGVLWHCPRRHSLLGPVASRRYAHRSSRITRGVCHVSRRAHGHVAGTWRTCSLQDLCPCQFALRPPSRFALRAH